MIEKLKKMGLTNYESQAYLALLKLDIADAGEIALKAKIPLGRIYSVLSSLEEQHLVRSQNTRPRKYSCVEPITAIDRLFNNKKEDLKHEEAMIETLSNELKSELLGMELTNDNKTFWTVAIGDESYELIHESISGSKKELLFFLASKVTSERIKKKCKTEQYIKIIMSLHDSVVRGVDVKVILNNDVDFSNLENFEIINKLLKHIGNKFNCKLAAIPITPFDIIDGENVLLQMQNPMDPDELFAVVSIKDINFAQELRKKFFNIWNKAEDYTLSEKVKL